VSRSPSGHMGGRERPQGLRRAGRTCYAGPMKRLLILLLVVAAVTLIALALAGVFRPRAPVAEVVVPGPPVVTIAVDAGHGGRDPGAVAGDVLEKEINLAIVRRLETLAAAHPELRVVLTRDVDISMTTEDRIRCAGEAGAAVYVSIHTNAFDDPSVHGVETWVDVRRADGDPVWTLAELVQDGVTASTGARDRGLRSGEIYLQHAEMPAVSVEVGFLTNEEERARLLDSAYQERICRGILDGVLAFLDLEEPDGGDETS